MRGYHVVGASIAAFFTLMALAHLAKGADLSPSERALGQRIGAEVQANLLCSTRVIELQDRVAVLEHELATLKAPDKK